MATLAALENLVTAQSAHFYTIGTVKEARAGSRLFSAAVDAGMPWDHDDLHDWVAIKVGEFLTSGPSDGDDGWDEDYTAIGEDGRWEYAA